ncbi:MAG TPA: MBG domain-containing protein [Pirellulales bacterium]|nr:MBG domain-containing protein [Pirellulales bacterium]
MKGHFFRPPRDQQRRCVAICRDSTSPKRSLRFEPLEDRRMLSVTQVNSTIAAGASIQPASTNLLGVNLASWDVQQGTAQTQQLTEAAGLDLFRFPGGATADDQHFNVANGITIPQFAQFISSVNGTGMVTVDYGSGSPQEAAAELAYLEGSPADTTTIGTGLEWSDSAKRWQSVNWQTVGYWASLRAAAPLAVNDGLNFLRIGQAAPFANINDWEIGNEEYGSWEIDHHGTAGPGGASTGSAHNPATYAAFSAQFNTLAAEITGRAGLPSISIGADSDDPTGQSDNNWTANVLADELADGLVPGFISDHSYAQSPGSENDSNLLNGTVTNPSSILDWSTRYAAYESLVVQALGNQASSVQVMATEYNSVSTNPGKQSTSLVNGLYVAESLGGLMNSGYSAAIIWDWNNNEQPGDNNSSSLYGWRQFGDYGLVGNAYETSLPAAGLYVPFPSYFGMQLASKIDVTGGTVVPATSSNNNLNVYAVMEANGDLDLLVVNTSPTASASDQFSTTGFRPGTSAQVWQYGETQDTAQSQSATGASVLANSTVALNTSGASFSYTFPAYSMTVLDVAPLAVTTSVTPSGTPAVYAAGAAATAVDAGVTVTSVDADLMGATVAISAATLQSGDTLSFTSPVASGIVGSYSGGALTLSGTATVAQYQTALQSVTFSNTSNPSTVTRAVSIVAVDNASNSSPASEQVILSPSTPAVVASDAGGTYNGNPFPATATAVGIDGAAVSGSFALTYYVGSSVSGPGSSIAPTDAGTYTVVAAFTSADPNDNSTTSVPLTFTIAAATPTVVDTDIGDPYIGIPLPPTVTGIGGAPLSGSFSFTYYVGSSVSGPGSPAVPTDPGTYTVVTSFASFDPDYSSASDAPLTFILASATPAVVASDVGGTYDGNPFAATATATDGDSISGSFALTYYLGSSISGPGSATAPTDAGTYTVVAAFTSSDPNENSTTSAPLTFTICAATPAVVASDAGGTYDGNPYPATVTATDMADDPVSGSFVLTYYSGGSASGPGSQVAPTDAGTCTVVATFTSTDPNYKSTASAPLTFTIAAAAPNIVESDAGDPYIGVPVPPTATGIEGASVSGSFALTYYLGDSVDSIGFATPPTDAGTYTVVAAFTSADPNYSSLSSTPLTFIIAAATPTVTASDPGGTYSGNPFPATAAATGIGAATVSGSFALTYYVGSSVGTTGSSTPPTSAGTYTVVAAFTSADPNYNGAASTPLTFIIAAATPTVTASDPGGTYSGDPFSATATATGIGGGAVSGSFTLTYYVGSSVGTGGSSTPPTSAGTYTVVATFTSADPDCSSGVSAPVTFSIAAATPTVTADPGGTYSGNPFPATATATGIGAATVSGSFAFTYYVGSSVSNSGSSTAPTSVGTYTVVATFTSTNSNYASAVSAPLTFAIIPATPSVVAVDAGSAYNGSSHPATATAKGIGGAAVSGSFVFSYYVGTGTSTTGSSTAPTSVGTYTVVATFTSTNSNYSGARSTPLTFTITPATPSVVAVDAGSAYNGSSHPATATAKGVGGATVSGTFAFLYYVGTGTNTTGSSTAPTSVGIYTVVATFTSTNSNYSGARSAPLTFTITTATPSVVAVDAGGVYNGSSHPATATAKGIGGATVSGSFAFIYYVGTGTNTTGSSTAPTTAGTYTVVATFTSTNSNYSGARSAPLTFTIGRATPTVVASDAGGPANGKPHPATATAKGVGGATVSGTFAFLYYVGTGTNTTGSSTAPTAAGTYTVVAVFTSTNSNYASVRSAPLTFTIKAAGT